MSWVKLDDQFFMHPKVLAAGRDARDLYLAGLTYTAGQLTDGYLPGEALPLIAAMAGVADAQGLAERLLDVYLWEKAPSGYVIHDYLDYNPTGDDVRATREARAEAGRRGGLSKSAGKTLANPVAKDEQKSAPSPSPSPSPSPIPVPVEELSGSPGREPEPVPAPNRRSDPRSKHPAIIAARAATGAKHYPPIELYDGLIQALGENPDTAKLGLCRQSWVERGYNPGAWTWATEWYAQGVPAKGARASPGGNGNGLSYGTAAIEAYLKRGGHGNT
ncbi:MAG: hypothetical protein M0R22_07590 [Dehalococcoidia bacterium]|jgi:hypothetical protein|nr:hypothetical protein [Dehalococcoidia bacterium]